MYYVKGERPQFDEFRQIVKPPYGGKTLNYLVVMFGLVSDFCGFTNSSFFALGAAYVSSALKESGRKVFTTYLSCRLEREIDSELLEQEIVKNDIDVLLVGGLTVVYRNVKQITDAAKKIKPKITTIVGGGLITSAPVYAMEALETADFGVIGEGEITVCELAYALEKISNGASVDWNSVNGIIYRKNQDWLLSPPREEIKNLDIVPWPDYKSFPYEDTLLEHRVIYNGETVRRKRTGTIHYGRSCPFNCTFCFHSSGQKYRQRSLESFFAELDYLILHYSIDYLIICDECIFYKEKDVEEFCIEIKKREILYTCQIRVDFFNKPLAEKMIDSGCRMFAFGLESANNSILKSMKKHITVEQIETALDICHELKAPYGGNFIFGDLEETYETAMSTFDWAAAHPKLNNVNFIWIVSFPGTHIFNIALERGIIKDPVQFIKDGCPIINVSKMSYEDRQAIEAEMILRNYQCSQHTIISDVKLIKGENGTVNIEGVCPYCGKHSIWRGRDPFRPALDAECEHCQGMLILFASDYANKEIFETNIARLCNGHSVAVWAIVGGIKRIYELAPSLSKDNVYFVDSSAGKQGMSILGKTVLPPSVIVEREIDTVILTITTSKSFEILADIKSRYPTVKKIAFAGDLLFENNEAVN